MLNVELKDTIRNTIITQRTRETDIVQYVANVKWKWDGHIAGMKDNKWTTRSAEWQTKGERSVGRPKRRWRDDIVGQQGAVWTRIATNRESWRTGGGLFPPVQGHSLEWNRLEKNS